MATLMLRVLLMLESQVFQMHRELLIGKLQISISLVYLKLSAAALLLPLLLILHIPSLWRQMVTCM